jgi:hypothetical protein
MTTIETTIQNRRIDIAAPDDLPDGTKVTINVTPLPAPGLTPVVDGPAIDEIAKSEKIKRYTSSEFTHALLQHMHEAKKIALRDRDEQAK